MMRRAAASAPDEQVTETYHHENVHGKKIILEENLFTNAFVNALGLPASKGHEPSKTERFTNLWGPTAQLVLVTIVQLLMAWTVYLHVQNDLILTKTRPLFTAFEMFVGTNVTIPLGTVVQLCGEWEDQEMKDNPQGPLATMNMPDGSVYASDDTYSFFYNLKQPTRSWDYGRLGSERSVIDDVMFVLSEGVSLNPFTPSGYSLLFILMLSIFFFSVVVEVRNITNFAGLLLHFCGSGSATEPWKFSKEHETFELVGVTRTATIVGVLGLVCRLTVSLTLLCLGTVFLLYTSLKIDLILNGLAILFVLELDKVIYSATVPARVQKFIGDVEPVSFQSAGSKVGATAVAQMIPILMFPLTFCLAVGVRAFQCEIFSTYFRMTAAVCLFAGPTTPFGQRDMMAPVTGFCDSLLGISCAPHVSPNSTAEKHGYCLITDQTTMTFPTVQFYLNDPEVFPDRYNGDGSAKAWTEWGKANPTLYKSKHWMDGPYQDLLRKNCLELYQKDTKPDDVLVDDDVGETMDGAPFYCKKEGMFEAIFGDVKANLGKLPIDEVVLKTKSLLDPDVVKAIGACNGDGASPRSAQPAASSFQLTGATEMEPEIPVAHLRRKGHKAHHEVATTRNVQDKKHHHHAKHAEVAPDEETAAGLSFS